MYMSLVKLGSFFLCFLCGSFVCMLVTLSDIASVFFVDYGRGLEKDVISETSGHFKRLLVSMLTVSILFAR